MSNELDRLKAPQESIWKYRLRLLLWLSIVLMAALATGGCVDAQGTPAGDALKSPPVPGFHATVYETRLRGDHQVGQLDTGELNARAAKGEDLQKTLAELGPTKIVYRVHHPVDPNGDCRIRLGSRVPRVNRTRVGPGGRRVGLLTYERLGATFEVHTRPAPQREDGKLHVRLSADLSIPGQSNVMTASGARAPT
ncbi:MAG: hypothetical protein WBF17_01580, partial [Phycisphaerae bacterium]